MDRPSNIRFRHHPNLNVYPEHYAQDNEVIMAEKHKISVGMNVRPGNPKMDLILEKLDQHRQDHQRQSGTMNSIADQVSRLQSLMARVKGETKAIYPSTEVMLRIEDKIIDDSPAR